MVLAGERRMGSWTCREAASAAGRQDLAGAREVGRSIDTERKRVNERHVDPHARLERAQLLETLAPLERRAPIGVEPDVVVVRPLAPGHHGAAEIERARDALARRESDRDLRD